MEYPPEVRGVLEDFSLLVADYQRLTRELEITSDNAGKIRVLDEMATLIRSLREMSPIIWLIITGENTE